MTRFKKILLVYNSLEDSNEALVRAFTLAQHNRAKLTIVDVIEKLPQLAGAYFEKISLSELEKMEAEDRSTEIRDIVEDLERRTKIKADVKVFIGTSFMEIIKEVLRNKHDLVMKTVEGKDGARRLLFGSIDINLMRKCPSPVWMVKPSESRTYSRILAAVDPDPFDVKRNELNDVIMELALSIARLEKSELHILHAWSFFGEGILRGPRYRKTESEIKRLLREARATHKEMLEKLISKKHIGKTPHKVHMQKGDPAELIPKIAKREKIDLIVMGTVCRTGLPGLIIGNTAESVLSRVNCSLLTVKPEGFVSPVTLED